jgi:hypothetical protein
MTTPVVTVSQLSPDLTAHVRFPHPQEKEGGRAETPGREDTSTALRSKPRVLECVRKYGCFLARFVTALRFVCNDEFGS